MLFVYWYVQSAAAMSAFLAVHEAGAEPFLSGLALVAGAGAFAIVALYRCRYAFHGLAVQLESFLDV